MPRELKPDAPMAYEIRVSRAPFMPWKRATHNMLMKMLPIPAPANILGSFK